MALSIGIVGLPNVGKSTLFNAITNSQAQAANYPFCTIEPNKGIVPICDERLEVLAKMNKSKQIIYSAIEFIDIAGIVKGASKGEGLGNKFLSHIREVNAIAEVVRCFEDENITHVSGAIDPAQDIETINLELILADLDSCEKTIANNLKKDPKLLKKEIKEQHELLLKIKTALETGKPVRSMELSAEEQILAKQFCFMTAKKIIYIANVQEHELNTPNAYTDAVKKIAERENAEFTVICAKIEEEISQLPAEEKKEFLKELGITCSGLDSIAKKCFHLLGLQTFLTTGEKETRAWTIRAGDTAPKAAGVIHTDFERGFIRANITKYTDYIAHGGESACRAKGLLRQEGKEYIMQEGDIVEFLFNV